MSVNEQSSTRARMTSASLSRRNFLRAAGAGTALAAGAGALSYHDSRAYAQGSWDLEADVVVIGSGAAGLSAAAIATDRGNSVIVLEKAAMPGGTSAKSGAVYWVPNNSLMRAEGLEDPREDALRLMARLSFPATYQASAPRFGLNEWDYSQLETYYDEGPTAIDELARIGALPSELTKIGDSPFPDYYFHLPENKQPIGRALSAQGAAPTSGSGMAMITPLVDYLTANNTPILVNHRVVSVVQNDKGEVIGVEVVVNNWSEQTLGGISTPEPDAPTASPTAEDEIVTVRARKAVIFGSGGFTHNRDLRGEFLRGPIFGGCEVLTNEGDLVTIATRLGAQLSNMNQAFWTQIVLEPTLEIGTNAYGGMVPGGDSMLEVNKYGVRVGGEKSAYSDLGQLHFTWDPVKSEYPNLVLFLIYDQRTTDLVGGQNPYPLARMESPYLIAGDTLEELTANINARLAELGDLVTNIQLSDTFAATLTNSISRFNGFAQTGVDEDFHRELSPFGMGRLEGNEYPSGSMYPLSETGPYYCILTGGGTLGTKGGPKINTRAQIVNADDQPIPGLYGAGNCIGSPSVAAYWSGGGTLGPAIIYGYLAAVNASTEPIKDL